MTVMSNEHSLVSRANRTNRYQCSTCQISVFQVRITLMPPKRPKVEPISDPTLFEMGKLQEAGRIANSLNVERPYSEPGLLLGTSAFTAARCPGSFYPVGMKPANYHQVTWGRPRAMRFRITNTNPMPSRTRPNAPGSGAVIVYSSFVT